MFFENLSRKFEVKLKSDKTAVLYMNINILFSLCLARFFFQ
jgi:hypothetical protein